MTMYTPDNISHRRQISCRHLRLLTLCLCMIWCAVSGAEMRSFSVIHGQKSYTIEADTEMLQSTEYVSLYAILQPTGGTVRIAGASVQIQLGGFDAEGTLNRTTIEAGGELIALKSPLQRSGSNAMIALQDLGPMLSKTFQLTVRENTRVSVRDLNADSTVIGDAQLPMAEPASEQIAVIPWSQIDTVVIDPGHGGTDMGITAGEGIVEKDLTLAVAVALRNQLKTLGTFKIYMTREADEGVSIQERINRCNQYKNAVLISLHAGASPSPRAHGVELFYSAKTESQIQNRLGVAGSAITNSFTPMNKGLADVLVESLTEATGTPARGVRTIPLRLFRESRMPGVLIELGFLTNPAETSRLKSEAYHERLAQGILSGLQQTLKKES